MAKYDTDKMYNVRLTRVVSYRGAELRPLHEHEIKGRALNTILEDEGPDVLESEPAESG